MPLNPEWVALAQKQLKGADPEELLTWRTPEVRIMFKKFILLYFVLSLNNSSKDINVKVS